MIINTAISLAWQKQRSDFNHDWLQNNFIVKLSDWSKNIQKCKWNLCTQKLFDQEVVAEWETCNQQLIALLYSYEKCMSPRVLLEDNVYINNMPPYWRGFLGNLMHSLWITRYDILAQTKKVRYTYAAANQVYNKLKVIYPNALALQDAEDLTRLFNKFKDCCLALRKVLSPLESSIRIV